MIPVVTIGICVKNSEATIKEAINSIVNQFFPQNLMEAIIVDGDSQDNTLAIIEKILSTTTIQMKIISSERGLGRARQRVVDNAKGKYIIWLDGDVILSQDYVGKQVNFMEKNPQVAIAVGRMGLLPNENWVALLESIGYVVEGLKYQGKKTANLIGTRGSILRVDAVKNVGGFNTSLKSHEDTDVAYKLKKVGWNFFITNTLLYERQKTTLAGVWKRHLWYGYGLHFLQHIYKGKSIFTFKTDDRIVISSKAYELTRRKVVFLLPFIFIMRKSALLFGFIKSHLDGYGHKSR